MNNYPLTPCEIEKVHDLKVKFHHKIDLYYSLSWNHEDRAKLYDEALALLDERLYIIMGV